MADFSTIHLTSKRFFSTSSTYFGSFILLVSNIIILGTNAADVALTLDAQGYVMNLQVSEISFSAEEAALALGIPSLWFRLEDYADTIRVIAKGIGHGYGMSQYGADRYAGEGRDYKWILQHYFQGCEVKDSSSR